MKKTSTLNQLLSLALCLCMVLSLLPVASLNAFAADMTGGEVLYLKPNSNWAMDNARFAAYFYGDGNTWESMVPVDGADGIYEVTVPGGRWTNVIFCRMNPSTETNSWDNKWNQSGDLVYDGINNLCTIHDGQWDCGNNVTWSSYPESDEPACPHDSHSQDGKCTACGETVEHTYVDGSCACGAVDPTEPVTAYCINSAKWDEVYAYVWGAAGNGAPWPGTAMTKTGETVNGFDIYEVTFAVAYENVIFNNNMGSQTGDRAFREGQYYDVKNGTWYESLDDVPVIDLLATDRYLVGSFNDWNTTANEFKLDAEGSKTGYVSLELEANTTYEFKVIREGAWTSCDTTITGDVSGLKFSSSVSDNCTITTTAAGTYVFAFGTDTSELSVTYPESDEPACTHDSHSQDGKCTACGETVEHTYVDGSCACGAVIEYMSIYFQNNWMWTDVKLHHWGSASGNTEWPGTAMTLYGNDGYYDIYVLEVPTDIEGITISGTKDDGSGALDKTPDITGGWYDGICYYMTWNDGNQAGSEHIDVIMPSTYTVTFAGVGTEYLQSVTVEPNTVITLPCRWYDLGNLDGRAFAGYNTESDGSGETYMDCTEYTVTGDVTFYTQWADIAIGDALLNSGEYVDNDGNVTASKPEGGYAHFEDGTLTLNNFTYTGEGYLFLHNPDYNSTAIAPVYYGMGDLNLVLEGDNILVNSAEGGYGLRGDMNVTVSGTGSLTASAGSIALYSGIDLTVESGTLSLTATETAGRAMYVCGDFTLNDGSVTLVSPDFCVNVTGDYNQGNITISGGKLDITSSDGYGLECLGSLIITGGTVNVNAGEEFRAVNALGGITIENVKILTPTNGTVQFYESPSMTQYYIADSEGNQASVVVIGEAKTSDITINMTDSYGDSWNGNAIEIYENGTLVGTATIGDGESATWTYAGDNTKEYSFRWVMGEYPHECAFEILFGEVMVFTATEDDCGGYADGEEVYSTCDHSYGEGVVTAPTCTEAGYTGYTCSVCGSTYVVDEVAALGHSFGEDGICALCGLDKNKDIFINMTDSYGDGWNGSAIEIYENGTLVGITTFDDGESATWDYLYDDTKVYSFRWVMGDYPEECAFEILIGGEVVFTATEDDCAGYADGQEIYNTCDHSYGEGVVTAPTCTEAGYTSYTCTVCGSTNIADEVAALGHSFGDDDICDTCGAEKTLSVTVHMFDLEGDGWNGNTIVIGSGEELVDMVTLEDSAEGSWTGELDPNRDYDFYWFSGEYTDECAFQVLINGEVIFETDDCDGYGIGQLLFSIIDGEAVIPEIVNSVFVGGVELSEGNYLDLDGNVSAEEPDGGYAYYDGTTLTFHDYTYTGKGYVIIEEAELDGEAVEITALVYTALEELFIQLEGTNTLNNTGIGYGVIVGMADSMDYEFGTLVFNGIGTLNLTSYLGITADCITLNSGIVNINAEAGIDTYNADSSLNVNGGALNITASGDEYSEGIRIGDMVINGGKVIVSCDGYLALDVVTLTVNGGYLEVVGNMEAYHPDIDEPITLGEGVSITSPEGAAFGTFYNNNGLLIHTICDADGNIADAFVIEGPDVEPGGDQEPFDVVVYNRYGMADTVTLSNPTAIPGQDYVTTVSSTVGSGIDVWSVYVAEEDRWYGNYIYEFDEETNTLTVFGNYVAEGMQIEVVPFVTLTIHMNGGSVIDDYWEQMFDPDETGTFTQVWGCGEQGYFFGVWDEETEGLLPKPNLLFKREGYTVVGYNTAADGSGTAYAVDALHKLTEDVEIYLIWEANSPINLESAALSFQEKIHYDIFFTLGIDENVEPADMGLIMFDSLLTDGTVDDAIAIYSGAVEMDGKYMVATDGIHAKYMGNTIYFRAYAKLADGSYVYSKTVQYSAVTYAEHILAGDEPESAKALVVAMLNYGAAAQMFFGYNTDNLVNAFLTDEQKALPEQYRDDMVNTVPVVAAEKQGIFANNKGFSKRMPAVSFEGAFEINYFFTPAYAPVDGITLYYWTEADFAANDVLTVDNATGSLKLEGTGTEQYRGDIGGIAAKNLSENIYVAAVYSDGTTTWTSGVLGYSIGAYCGRLATNGGTIADLAMATAVYGYHAKQYFG